MVFGGEGGEWSERADWALVDGAKEFTRRSREGEEVLFYEELVASSTPLASRSPEELRRRLASLDKVAPREPRTLEKWRRDGDAYSGELEGDATTLRASRESLLEATVTRYIETTGGELVRLGAEAAVAAASAAANDVDDGEAAPLVGALQKTPLAAALAGGAILLNVLWFAFAFQSASPPPNMIGGAIPQNGGTFFAESTTIVTQTSRDDNGDAVTRVQRRRAVRSDQNPAGRVETQTVVRKTTRGDDGTLIKTTTRDRVVNPVVDVQPKAVSSAEMAKLLRDDARSAPPPTLALPGPE